MSDTLSYADAVRLLGGGENRWVDLIDRMAGGAVLSAAIPVPGLADANVGLVGLGRELLRAVAERRSGLSRYDRTRRLEAAHAVIAVTAYFEALAEVGPPDLLSELDVVRSEQLALAGARPTDPRSTLEAMFALPVPVPGPALPYPRLRGELRTFYTELAGRLTLFTADLREGTAPPWHAIDPLNRAIELGLDRHRELLTRLAGDFPEVGFWIGLHEQEATRAEVRALGTGLAELRAELDRISTGAGPDARRAALATAYTAELDRPIAASGDVPAGLRLPTLGGAYVPPLFRVAELGVAARPAEEEWWADRPLRGDLAEFLVGQLTSPGAVRAPLLVLGQPGSGKSVLTKILAARLPAADFLAVRVVLRDVPAAADLQEQLEHAIRDATGDRPDWPALASAAGDALPVVLLDGFDELLQATGVSQTDYLTRVAEFQRRESVQGRPVAVLVTSRTSVADRARPPAGALALRLEPFDPARVQRWLDTWNETNAGLPGFTPLPAEVALRHRELAEQPLLLLMLALYDAGGGDLRAAGDLRHAELYERLLDNFARREVVKQRELTGRELDRAVEDELRRLSVVAFAMFNRRAQWSTEDALEADLAALPFDGAAVVARDDRRTPLRAAEIVLGRFFFVHRSQASRDADRPIAYEFLHATFGEYLVARLTWQVVENLVAVDRAASLAPGGPRVDDDLLYALLSHAVLTSRAPVVGFLAERLSILDDELRAGWADLLVRLFRTVNHRTGPRALDGYRPLPLPVPARYAAYAANLLVLAVCAAGEITGSRLYPEADDPVPDWHAQALLWRSQLHPEEWSSLVAALELGRRADGQVRDVALRLDSGAAAPPIDLTWTYSWPGDGELLELASSKASGQPAAVLRRKTYFECGINGDVLQHALDPLVEAAPWALTRYVSTIGRGAETAHSVAWILLAAMLGPVTGQPLVELRSVRQYLDLGLDDAADDPSGSEAPEQSRLRLLGLLLDRLSADASGPVAVAVDLLDQAVPLLNPVHDLAEPVLRCCLAFLGRGDRNEDRAIADVVARAIGQAGQSRLWTGELALEARVRLHELGVRTLPIAPQHVEALTALHQRRRPDLLVRMRPLIQPAD
ncbi:NACHT domain-containing NTPase [Plantactinospora sp. KBS50]|uniref:NACHT domain-containing protein n=1 Tax=Plantactinospora sp. KBS50 TaxID=2024580 RepID=UPI000BAAF7A3|nr:hypothetical protein [Plantactinospora sp. KBS50]ASW56121.1 hypothetical protein CIK06_21030 [Plantactinospora sp. KBS50]